MTTRGRLKLSLSAGFLCLFITLPTAYGEDDWRKEFDLTCAQSNDAMALSMPELQNLIERCNRLEKKIDVQEDTIRRVFLKRLHLCKNLYLFILDAKISEQKQK